MNDRIPHGQECRMKSVETEAAKRIADWLELRISDDDHPFDQLTRMYVHGIRQNEWRNL